MTYRDEPWHKECFLCAGCKIQLAGQHFTSRDDRPYCLKCFGNLYAKKCEACSKPITGTSELLYTCMIQYYVFGVTHLHVSVFSGFGGGKYISFEERQWHQSCFTCTRCSVSLVGAGFFPESDEILCRECNSNI